MPTKRYFTPKTKPRFRGLRYALTALVVAGVVYGAYALIRPLLRSEENSATPPVQASTLSALDEAQARFQAGDLVQAKELLKPLLEQSPDPVAGPQAMLLSAEIALAEANPDAAVQTLATALEQFAGSADRPQIALRLARVYDAQGKFDEALKLYEDIQQTAPPNVRAGALVGLGQRAERAEDLIAARDLYRRAAQDADYDTPVWDEAVDALGRLNVNLIFARSETPESKFYSIEPGDNLTNIGVKLNTTQGLLFTANGITDATQLRVGQRLKYTPKDFRVIVERSRCRLFLLDKDGLFKRYRVGLGKPGYETTLGKYTVGNKQKDPTWFRPGGSPVPPLDPENELGTRWMPLVPADPGLPTDLGIHGTIAPETIGTYSSRGCPRLVKEEVEELFDLIVRSTPVEIVETVTEAMLESIAAEPTTAA